MIYDYCRNHLVTVPSETNAHLSTSLSLFWRRQMIRLHQELTFPARNFHGADDNHQEGRVPCPPLPLIVSSQCDGLHPLGGGEIGVISAPNGQFLRCLSN